MSKIKDAFLILRVSKEVKRRVESQALESGLSVSEYIRRALENEAE